MRSQNVILSMLIWVFEEPSYTEERSDLYLKVGPKRAASGQLNTVISWSFETFAAFVIEHKEFQFLKQCF